MKSPVGEGILGRGLLVNALIGADAARKQCYRHGDPLEHHRFHPRGKTTDQVRGIPQGKVDIPVLNIPDEPMAGSRLLSKEAVSITAQTIQKGASTEDLAEALEVGYRGFGEIACTDAAKEGISAFLERRKPEFKK